LRRAAALLAVCLGVGGCSSMKVDSDWDRSARFDTLHTWNWISTAPAGTNSDSRAENPLLQRRIQSAIETELARHGFVRSASGTPDFLVGYHLAVDQKIDADTVYRGYGAGPYRGVYGPTTYVRQYDVGTLLIDVLQPQPREVIWRGWAKAPLEEGDDVPLSQREERAQEAVTRILERFPPPGAAP
jgi:hypothetical protein